MLLKAFFLSFFLSLFFPYFHMAYGYSPREAYTIEISPSLDKKLVKTLAKEELREKIISLTMQDKEIEPFLNLIRGLGFNTQQVRTLVALSAEIHFFDSYSYENKDENSYIYTIYASLENKDHLLSQLKININKYFLRFRTEEVEKERRYIRIKARNALSQIKQKQEITINIALLEEYSQHLKVLDELYSYIKEIKATWENPEEKRRKLEKMRNLAHSSLPLSNALAEIYIYLDRPQAALDLLQEVKDSHSFFSEYLKVLIALRRGEIYLAKVDLKKSMELLEPTNELYRYFIVLQGSIAQIEGKIEEMCNSYKRACVYDICAPYFAVEALCTP